MEIIKSPLWRKFLRCSAEVEMGKDTIVTTPFREMIKIMPSNAIMWVGIIILMSRKQKIMCG